MITVKRTIALLTAATSLMFAGCRYDGTGTKMQWAPDMADSPAPKAQRTYLDPPEGSAAYHAAIYPKTPEEAEARLKTPDSIANDPEVLAKGKVLFDTFCSPCHGGNGKGGAVSPAIVPPDLTHQVYQGRGDGFFFYRATFGTAVMPGYGYATTEGERWYIVKYLRSLQKGN